MSWQPIETAPKDGTPILVYFPDLNAVREVSWVEPHWADEGECEWCVDDNTHGPFPLPKWCGDPTHWMPMPAPPSEGDTPTPPVVDTQATVSVEAYEQLRKEVTEMAQKSVRRELALARLEVHVESMRGAYAQLEKEATEIAQENVRQELALAKLEAEVMALREAYTQSQKEVPE